jgi:hypothetical protein
MGRSQLEGRRRSGLEEITFDKAATKRWADFSGDYNPIHFELEKARLVGADHLITHGMLVILHACKFVDEFIENDIAENSNWTLYKSLMSRPVPQDVTVNLSCARKTGSLRITAEDGEEICFKANVKRIPAWTMQPIPGKRTELLSDRCESFFEIFPNNKKWWHALNAVVFADFISNRSDVIRAIIEAKVGYGLADPSLIIVHISHSVSFDSRFLSGLPTTESKACSYEMNLTDLLEKNENILCTIQFNVFWDEDVVMTIEMGLMIKI